LGQNPARIVDFHRELHWDADPKSLSLVGNPKYRQTARFLRYVFAKISVVTPPLFRCSFSFNFHHFPRSACPTLLTRSRPPKLPPFRAPTTPPNSASSRAS